MFRTKLLKWSRKLHKWVGIYISILTVIWLVEMMVLPSVFNSGLPTVDDGSPSSMLISLIVLIVFARRGRPTMHCQGSRPSWKMDTPLYMMLILRGILIQYRFQVVKIGLPNLHIKNYPVIPVNPVKKIAITFE